MRCVDHLVLDSRGRTIIWGKMFCIVGLFLMHNTDLQLRVCWSTGDWTCTVVIMVQSLGGRMGRK